MRFLITLLSLVMAFSAFAADDKAKDTAVVLKGEHKIGVPGTADDGYRIYFSEDKQTYLNLGGYTRLMTVFALDGDRQSNPTTKAYVERFRFYLDGQSDKQWSFHTRFDYRQNTFATKSDTNYGTAGIYVARAYLTYKMSDMFSVDFGRISNQIYRFDVMAKPNIRVGNGVMPKFTFGKTSLVFTANQNNVTEYTNTPSTARGDNPADVSGIAQSTTIGSRIGHTLDITKDFAFGFGFMGQTEIEVTASAEKTTQLMPDLMITGPRDFYLLNQTLKKVYSKHTQNLYENYTEMGMGFANMFYPDINYTLTQEASDARTVHTIAPELLVKHTTQISTLWTVIFDDIKAKSSADKTTTFKAYMEFYF